MFMFPQRYAMSAVSHMLGTRTTDLPRLDGRGTQALALAPRELTLCKHYPRFDDSVNASHLPRRWRLGIELYRAAQYGTRLRL